MNAFCFLALAWLASSSLLAQIPAATATTGKPNVFGEKKTVLRDGSGRVTGTATTRKPNVFGEEKTVIRDASGRVTGTATTTKPNIFGEQKTVIRDASGRVTGWHTAGKQAVGFVEEQDRVLLPRCLEHRFDVLGRVAEVFRDHR